MDYISLWITLEKKIKHGKTLDQENGRQNLESQKRCTSTASIEENLIGFLAVPEMIGEYLMNTILGELEKYGLDIQNCRGQAYDNGTNMEKKGVLVSSSLFCAKPLAPSSYRVRFRGDSQHETKPMLKNLITKSAGYDEEDTKLMHEGIVEERKERELLEERKRRDNLELEKLRIEAQIGLN
ncbi:hypothetical protein TNCV_3073601 [Trichonephila clavipes]|nr:hypothetical protein TNCV_3073601 [Trichonephila clavipes]